MTEEEYKELKVILADVGKYRSSEMEMTKLREEILKVKIDSAFLQLDSKRKIEIRLTDEYGNRIDDLTDYLDYDVLCTIHAELCRFFARRIEYFKQLRENIKFYKCRPYKK